MKKLVTGEFSCFGYAVLVDTRVVYTAGNHRLDSAVVIDPDHPYALGIADIEAFCVQTGKEIAEEVGGTWGGAYERKFLSIREDYPIPPGVKKTLKGDVESRKGGRGAYKTAPNK